jgi:ketosteroid isomerase-like protein
MTEAQPTLTTNKARMEHIFAETAKGNGRPFLDAFAEDGRWTITGSTGWSKTYDGKAAIMDELIAPLRRVLAPPIKTHARRIVAEDDIVVVEARGENRTRDGRPYENTYCYVFQFRDGKVMALTEYADTELFRSALGEPG